MTDLNELQIITDNFTRNVNEYAASGFLKATTKQQKIYMKPMLVKQSDFVLVTRQLIWK